MSSNKENGYKITSTELYEGALCNLTKSSSDSGVCLNAQKAGGAWIQIELPTADRANVLKIAGGFSNEEPDSFILKASNDGINYDVLLDSGALTWGHNETKTWELENKTAYKFYKIEAVNTKTEYITISDIQLAEETQIKEY